MSTTSAKSPGAAEIWGVGMAREHSPFAVQAKRFRLVAGRSAGSIRESPAGAVGWVPRMSILSAGHEDTLLPRSAPAADGRPRAGDDGGAWWVGLPGGERGRARERHPGRGDRRERTRAGAGDAVASAA